MAQSNVREPTIYKSDTSNGEKIVVSVEDYKPEHKNFIRKTIQPNADVNVNFNESGFEFSLNFKDQKFKDYYLNRPCDFPVNTEKSNWKHAPQKNGPHGIEINLVKQ